MHLNPFDVVRTFEHEMAAYTGAPRAVAVDSCTSALFLCFKRVCDGRLRNLCCLSMPKKTHISVPTMAIHAGAFIEWRDEDWGGVYPIVLNKDDVACKEPVVWDAALRMRKHMFNEFVPAAHESATGVSRPVAFACLSFQYRKHLPIGRGGMILHNGSDADDEFFRRMRFFGRAEVPAMEDPGPTLLGWHCYMTPDEAARGLCFMQNIPVASHDLEIDYPDLSQYEVLRAHTVVP